MDHVIETVFKRGQHAAIYGERGVGKTSLASIMAEVLAGVPGENAYLVVRVNCDHTDSYSSMWRKALDEIRLLGQIRGAGLRPDVHEAVTTATSLLPDAGSVAPNDVRKVLEVLAANNSVVAIFFDEFDSIEDGGVRPLLADTIKMLSDQSVDATLFIVGVADSVDELVTAHESVERSLRQIQMPRMSSDELREIVTRGLSTCGMSISENALDRIVSLSQGLPHYAHVLAQLAALAANEEERQDVSQADVGQAITAYLAEARHTLTSSYAKAVFSNRETLYPSVLLAAALTKGDELGFFAPADVRAPLSTIMGKMYDIPSFLRHLYELTEATRGSVLQKAGKARAYKFRFRNPLMQPHVIMKGLADGLIDNDTLLQLL
jgi:Cdc6-like AAA superfamily ATPase